MLERTSKNTYICMLYEINAAEIWHRAHVSDNVEIITKRNKCIVGSVDIYKNNSIVHQHQLS